MTDTGTRGPLFTVQNVTAQRCRTVGRVAVMSESHTQVYRACEWLFNFPPVVLALPGYSAPGYHY